MSERQIGELVVIDPADIFEQNKFSPEQMRDAFDKLALQVEEKRLLAWVTYIADPRNDASKKAYETLCKEQGRIMTAFNRWRQLNPEAEE